MLSSDLSIEHRRAHAGALLDMVERTMNSACYDEHEIRRRAWLAVDFASEMARVCAACVKDCANPLVSDIRDGTLEYVELAKIMANFENHGEATLWGRRASYMAAITASRAWHACVVADSRHGQNRIIQAGLTFLVTALPRKVTVEQQQRGK